MLSLVWTGELGGLLPALTRQAPHRGRVVYGDNPWLLFKFGDLVNYMDCLSNTQPPCLPVGRGVLPFL